MSNDEHVYEPVSEAEFAQRLLDAATSLYDFAKENKGIYSNCVKQAEDYYG